MGAEIKAFARISPIANLSELSRVASHGRRLDPSAKTRVDPERTPLNVSFSRYARDPLDLVGAWRAATEKHGAEPYGRAPIAAHLLVGVSPALIDETGSRHDPANPGNLTLIRESIAWAESAFGAGSVIAGRLDVDEHGGGVVDLVVVPVREARMNRSATKVIISLSKALAEIHSASQDDPTSYGALQSSWAGWAMQRIDPRIVRGKSNVERIRKHVHVDVFRYVASECERELRADWSTKVETAQAEIEEARAEVQAEATALAERVAAAEKFEGELEVWRAELERFEERQDEKVSRAVSKAIEGLKTGIAAFRDGKLSLIESEDGRTAARFPRLGAAEKARLQAALKPAWGVGLLDILSDLDQRGEAFGEGGPSPRW